LLIKYIKSVLWRVAKCLSYIKEARCLKVNLAQNRSAIDGLFEQGNQNVGCIKVWIFIGQGNPNFWRRTLHYWGAGCW